MKVMPLVSADRDLAPQVPLEVYGARAIAWRDAMPLPGISR